MILYPNCSELIASIEAENEDEIIAALEDILRCLNGRLYLDFSDRSPFYRYFIEETDASGKTILKICDYGTHPELEQQGPPMIKFNLEIPIDLNRSEDRNLIFQKQIDCKVIEATITNQQWFFEDNQEQRIFRDVKLDLSHLNACMRGKPFSIRGINLEHVDEYSDEISLYLDRIGVFLRISDLDYERFPIIKKVKSELQKIHDVRIHTWDGGRSSPFERWALINYIQYVIQKSRSDRGIWINAMIYILKLKNIPDLKHFLKKLEKIGVMLGEYDRENRVIEQLDPLGIENVSTIGDPHLVINGIVKKLRKITLVPQNLDIDPMELDRFAYHFRLSVFEEFGRKNFCIFRDDLRGIDDERYNTVYDDLDEYLKKHAEEIIDL